MRLKMTDQPAPSPFATIASATTLVLSPVALFFVLLHAAFNRGPTTGGAYVELETMFSDRIDGPVQSVTTVVVESWDPQVVGAYYLIADLGHGFVALAVALIGLVSLCVLLRRPFSRAVSVFLLVVVAYATAAYFTGPAAREWAQRRVIKREDPGAGPDLQIAPVAGDWYAWHGLCATVAIVAVAAALYVAHARHLRSAVPHSVV